MPQKFKICNRLIITALLFSFYSCGADKSGSPEGSWSSASAELENENLEGHYSAILTPLNTSVAGISSGIIRVKILGDDISVVSTVASSPSGVKHLQILTTAAVCPDVASDINNDSYIDINEALSGAGILIPFDSDLSEQLAGIDYGPISNNAGSYIYRRSTSVSKLISDLQAPDPDHFDKIVKLPVEKNLKLNGGVILIQGVLPSSNLPETIATIGESSRESLLPIACGQLMRVPEED